MVGAETTFSFSLACSPPSPPPSPTRAVLAASSVSIADVGAASAAAARSFFGGYALTAATSAWITEENVAAGFAGPLGRDDPEGAPSLSLSLSLASLSSAADLSTIVRRPEPGERSMCAHFSSAARKHAGSRRNTGNVAASTCFASARPPEEASRRDRSARPGACLSAALSTA